MSERINKSAKEIIFKYGILALRSPAGLGLLRHWAQWNARNYDIANTIVVASSPRGGSTWLAEIVASLPGYPLLFEPLQRQGHPEQKQYNLNGWKYVPSGIDNPLMKAYLSSVLTGERLADLISPLHFYESLKQLPVFRGFLVKFTQANLLLYWMLQNFPVRAVFMIRHPCAVVSSQLRHPLWDITKESLKLSQSLVDDYPHLANIYQSLNTREEFYAFRWAVENFIVFRSPKPYPWYLTIYERLVMEGSQELQRIFQFLDYRPPGKAYDSLSLASATTSKDSALEAKRGTLINKDKHTKLAAWQYRLKSKQVKMILEIATRVGIEFYNDDLMPDYEKLFSSVS